MKIQRIKTGCLIKEFAQNVGKGLCDKWRGLIVCGDSHDYKSMLCEMRSFINDSDTDEKPILRRAEIIFPDGERLRVIQDRGARSLDKVHGCEFGFIGYDGSCKEWASHLCRSSCKKTPLIIATLKEQSQA